MSNKYPMVFAAVPTGSNKEYAMLYMLASLRNIDYPHNRFHLTIAITHLGSQDSEVFIKRVKELVRAANMPYPVDILITYPVMEDMERWGPYYAIIMNTHALRLKFLRSKARYFWLLGGDNPTPRGTLKKLWWMNVDVASATINQRKTKVKMLNKNTKLEYPVYWDYFWHLNDLFDLDLEPVLMDALRTAWLEFMFLDSPDPEQKERILHNSVFGSGCSLIKREVLEYIGYALGSGGTHSEDLHFCSHANLRGFDTAINLDVTCSHFDKDGLVY